MGSGQRVQPDQKRRRNRRIIVRFGNRFRANQQANCRGSQHYGDRLDAGAHRIAHHAACGDNRPHGNSHTNGVTVTYGNFNAYGNSSTCGNINSCRNNNPGNSFASPNRDGGTNVDATVSNPFGQRDGRTDSHPGAIIHPNQRLGYGCQRRDSGRRQL